MSRIVGRGLLAGVLFFFSIATGWAQTFEITGGETVFSQNSQYYFGEVGDFFNLKIPSTQNTASGQPDVGTASTNSPTLHLFVVASYFAYQTTGSPGVTENAYNGLTPAAGIRLPFQNGFIEGDLGIALAQAYQSLTPIQSLIGIYAQGEFYRTFGSGALDIFGNYTGYIQYIYLQARYLTPVWATSGKATFYLGPELIGQGNNTYNAGQGGVALGISLPKIDSYLTVDGGLLRSSISTGWGGYEGFSWYISF